MPTPFIIDTDCGIDDAVAILMALYHPAAEVVGITTLSGNVKREHVTRNVCDLLSYVDHSDIPVFEGADRPLVQDPVLATSIHGPTGLGTVDLPESGKAPVSANAAAGIAEMLQKHTGATVVALGPLTNIAITLNLYPEVAERIGSLVIMGGALHTGNVTRFAEFNFFADPEAADVVFRSGVPLTVVPWEACMASRMNRERLAEAVGNQARKGKLVQDLQEWIFRFMEKRYGEAFTALADPVAMAVALDPNVVWARHDGYLKLELGHNALRGASVPWNGSGMNIIDELDMEAFVAMLQEVFTT